MQEAKGPQGLARVSSDSRRCQNEQEPMGPVNAALSLSQVELPPWPFPVSATPQQSQFWWAFVGLGVLTPNAWPFIRPLLRPSKLAALIAPQSMRGN